MIGQNGIRWDKWQRDILEWNGDMTLRCGRQTGKSTVIGEKVANVAVKNGKLTFLITAAAHRQAMLIYQTCLDVITRTHECLLKEKGEYKENLYISARANDLRRRTWERNNGMFAEDPTATCCRLNNGTVIYCWPLGKTGYSVRGLPVDVLVVDEAPYVPDTVFNAIIPTMAASKKLRGFGWQWLLGTPFGKSGYFFNKDHEKGTLHVHFTSEQCPRIDPAFLAKERARMSRQEYAQEYLAEYVDDFRQFFPTELIKRCSTIIGWNFEKDYNRDARYYLGVDVARYGGDENAFVVAEIDRNNFVRVIITKTTERRGLLDSLGEIRQFDKIFHFRKIFIDDGGVGGGLFDVMIDDSLLKRRVVALNNATRSIDIKRSHAILKEDLYSSALCLMEANKCALIYDTQLLRSLRTIVYEYTSNKNVMISGAYAHLAEAMVRALWGIKDKGLKCYIA